MSEEAKRIIKSVEEGKLPDIFPVDEQSENDFTISTRGLNNSEYGLQTKNNSKKKDK